MAKNNSVWLNYVSDAMIHTYDRKDGKGQVSNITIPVAESKTGYGSFAVSAGQVKAGVVYGKGGVVKSTKDNAKNILLGTPDRTRKVSICTKLATKKAEAQYGEIELTNAQIAELFNSARDAYFAAQTETEELPEA